MSPLPVERSYAGLDREVDRHMTLTMRYRESAKETP